MDPKYLPSKQFIAKAIIALVLIIVAFGVYKITIFIKNKLQNKGQTSLIIKSDVIQKDSNNNGIPDWEESLWGLNPKGDGSSNKEFILAQRETLAKENALNNDTNQPLSENETLSREFFSVIMSLQESGNLDEVSIKAVGDTIGQKIIAAPIPDLYTKSMVLSIKANPASTSAYTTELANLFNKYKDKDIGKELTFISVGLTNNDPQAFIEADKVASAYRSAGKELLKIQVPNTLSDTHLALANNYEKVAQSIEGMSDMITNPLSGMKAVINYKKYTDALVSNVETLSKNL